MREKDHHYGGRVHVVEDTYLETLLTRLCAPWTVQPDATRLMERLYTGLAQIVLGRELKALRQMSPTRMCDVETMGALSAYTIVNNGTELVLVDVARAGTVPTQVFYKEALEVLNPGQVRKDLVVAERGPSGTVINGTKIRGTWDKKVVVIADPMGASGGTTVEVCRKYESLGGSPHKIVLVHLIVAPEYIRRLQVDLPEAHIYTMRVDRGRSSPKVLASTPGTYPDEEFGLDEKKYIHPGLGGAGELMSGTDD